MWFSVNWRDGYEVGVHMVNEHGYMKYHPLRNFGERQGDAKLFKEVDCPRLSETAMRTLIKNYSPAVKYRRENGGRRFVRVEK